MILQVFIYTKNIYFLKIIYAIPPGTVDMLFGRIYTYVGNWKTNNSFKVLRRK